MRVKTVALLVVVLACVGTGLAQPSESYEECIKHLPVTQKLRVSPRVVQGFVQQKTLPEVSDLKSIKTADVEVKIMINDAGAVACAVGLAGEPSLFERSADAARHWKFRPYELNGKPINVESSLLFHFSKGKVQVRFPQMSWAVPKA